MFHVYLGYFNREYNSIATGYLIIIVETPKTKDYNHLQVNITGMRDVT